MKKPTSPLKMNPLKPPERWQKCKWGCAGTCKLNGLPADCEDCPQFVPNWDQGLEL